VESPCATSHVSVILTCLLSSTLALTPVYVRLFVFFAPDRGCFFFHALVGSKSLNLTFQNLASRRLSHFSIIWCHVYSNILNRSGVDHECDRQTKGRTDVLIAKVVWHYAWGQKLHNRNAIMKENSGSACDLTHSAKLWENAVSDYIQRVPESNRRTRLSTVGDRAFPVAGSPSGTVCRPMSP